MFPLIQSPTPVAVGQSRYATVGGHEIHYLDWGSPDAPVVVLWHGLARTCHDFDRLAAALAPGRRVICPDTIGRGLSEWSTAPKQDYCFEAYGKIARQLLDDLGVGEIDWIGTSMGGAFGIYAAATVLRDRVRRLVLNDIGPTMPPGPLARIGAYIGQPPAFRKITELESYFRTTYAPFGWHSDAEWQRMTETMCRRLADGRVTPHHDPAIAGQFFDHPDDFEQWDRYDTLTAKTLVLRGENSVVLPPEVAEAMAMRGPMARIVEVADCGHAPALNTAAQIRLITDFLGI